MFSIVSLSNSSVYSFFIGILVTLNLSSVYISTKSFVSFNPVLKRSFSNFITCNLRVAVPTYYS